MLVDESAFDFSNPQSEINAWLACFLYESSGECDIFVLTTGEPSALQQQLRSFNLFAALKAEYQQDQSFLSDNVKSWFDYDGQFADILLTANEDAHLLEGYDFLIHPETAATPNYAFYFWEYYEDNAMHARSHRAFADLDAQLQIHRIQMQARIDRLYGDRFEDIWRKILKEKNIIELLQLFAQAKAPVRDQHPQDKAKETLRHYFEYAATDAERLWHELFACKSQIAYQIKACAAPDLYPRSIPEPTHTGNREDQMQAQLDSVDAWLKTPLRQEHRTAVNRALLKINNIVKQERPAPA